MYYERLQLLAQQEKRASTIHGSGYDKFMSTFPGQRDMKPASIPATTFLNKQTSQEAFKQQKSSVPYISVNKDAQGNPYLDGAQTQKNIFGGDADFQQRAEAQMGRARAQQAAGTGLSKHKGNTLEHPIVLNPGNKDRRGLFNFNNYGPSVSGNPNRNVPINIVSGARENYRMSTDEITMANRMFPTNGTAFPQPTHSLPPNEAIRRVPSSTQGYDQYQGLHNNYEPVNERYRIQNVFQEEATHAQSPTMYYTNFPKNNDPNVFAPKDKLPGEYHDDAREAERQHVPIVPGMQGTYDQWPPEFVKSRKLDQNDAQATYRHRIQNGKELLDYHNMHKVYGTDDEWTNSQANLTQQQAQALGRLRAQSEMQRQQEWSRQQEEYNQGKRPTPPPPVQQMPLKPVQSTYDFIDQTDLMKQVRNSQSPGRMDKVASALNSSYNSLMNPDRLTKIAAILQKATDGLKLSDRPSGKRIQPARVMSTPASAELIQQKRENEGDCQAKQAYVVDYIAFPADGTKQAYDLSGRMEAQAIMDRIYNEDPSYWPYGLGIPGHDGVYLIRDKMTKQAAGFVGWQQMLEGGRLIGSYSIGILPEYRGHGFAKEAVAKILREKAAGVDEVRSYVMPHNQKSKALASSLGVPVHEEF